MPGERLILFVKNPRPGGVKTRLAQDLGAEDAAELYRAMAEHVLAATRPGGYDRVVRFAPADAEAEIARWLPEVPLAPQAAGDLGRRMADAFERAFAEGDRRVALIGTDAPSLGREHVERALAALRDQDLVLGPTCDGGYYLVGLTRPQPALFEGIAWSTASVLTATLERARALGLRRHLLPELRDVDTLDDVRSEWQRLAPLLRGREALLRRLRPEP